MTSYDIYIFNENQFVSEAISHRHTQSNRYDTIFISDLTE
jgi:hypothetical protein